jgi:O-antigen/teichoic acid export membrane protein
MVAYNFWLVTRRLTMLLAAVALYWLNPLADPARGLAMYGWLFCALQCLGMGISVAIIMWQDRRLFPAPSMATRQGAKSIVAISGWNVGIQTSQMLALPGGAVIMNLSFGLVYGNMVFGLAMTLAGYARMFASGMTMGLDAVSARLSTTSDDHSMRKLVQSSTFLHGLAAFPAVVGIAVLALPFLQVWVGSTVDDPEQTLPLAASLTRVLLIGFLVMCIGDGWTRILFGAGFVSRYGPAVIWSNVLTPVAAIVLLWVMPQAYKFTAAAWGFAITYFAAQALFVPRIVASSFAMRWAEVYGPLIRLAVIAALCIPLVACFHWIVRGWNVGWMVLAAIPYGLAYTAIVWLWAVGPQDRSRLVRAALKLVSARGSQSDPAATP